MNKMVDFSSLYELDRGQASKKSWGCGWLLAVLLPVLALIGFLYYSALPVAHEGAAVSVSPTFTPTITWTPIPVLTATSQPSPQPAEADNTPGKTAISAGCTDWSQVSLKDLNKNMCIQGDYLQTYQRDDGAWVMTFSDEPGTFQVWSSAKSFDNYLKSSTSHCVRVQGWIMTSGVRPMIILSPACKLEPCP